MKKNMSTFLKSYQTERRRNMTKRRNIVIVVTIMVLWAILLGMICANSEKEQQRAVDYLNRQVETIDTTIKKYRDGLMTEKEFNVIIADIESEMRNDIANGVYNYDATYYYSIEVLEYCVVLSEGDQERIGEQFFKVYEYYYGTR